MDPCAEPGPRRRGGHEAGRSTGTAVGTRALVEPPAAARSWSRSLGSRHQDGHCNRHGRAGEREGCELSERLIGGGRSTRSTSDVGKSQFGNRIRPGTSPEPAPTRAVLKDISSRDEVCLQLRVGIGDVMGGACRGWPGCRYVQPAQRAWGLLVSWRWSPRSRRLLSSP